MTTEYHLHAEGVDRVPDREETLDRLDRLNRWDLSSDVSTELEIGPDWIDYVDLALKALLVVAAFVIAAKL